MAGLDGLDGLGWGSLVIIVSTMLWEGTISAADMLAVKSYRNLRCHQRTKLRRGLGGDKVFPE